MVAERRPRAGEGEREPNPTPTQILTGVAQVAANGNYSLALKDDGTLWSFGLNEFGQLGTATNSGTTTPNPTPPGPRARHLRLFRHRWKGGFGRCT